MAQKIGLDIGGKRTGIAITDTSNIIASGLKTVDTKELIQELKALIAEHEVDAFAIGKPVNLDGSDTHGTSIVEKYVKKIKNAFPTIPIHFIDERFTSVIAKQSILASGAKKKKRQDKALVDQVSATIILQSFLDLQV